MVEFGTVRRNGTYARLVSAKKIGFLGAIALLFNAATGPGLPFTPRNFESPGYIFTIFCFSLFAFISGFSILFIIEAMQAIPGNKHFQGNVEYGTLINFYFKQKEHILGQIMLYGALQSNAIQSIVLSSQVLVPNQAIDNLLIDIFGKTCGMALSGPRKGWICVASPGELPSPFGETFMLCTLGLLVVLFMVIPLGLTNLDDNMWVQYGAFGLSVFLIGQWVSSAFINGLSFERIKAADPVGLSYGAVLGTVMLNLAITVIIPSWINIKSKDVNVQKTVWSSIGLIIFFYLVPGILLALGFSTTSDNILSVLLTEGLPRPLTKLTVYLFAFAMLIPAIPVNLIISRENLTQNKITSDRIASVLCFLVPWLVCIPLQTGNLLAPFQTWTSSIFVSCSNFIIPVLIYFKCKVFRSQYNADRILSIKQLELLKQIHVHSNRIAKHIGKKKEALSKGPSRVNSLNDQVEPQIEMTELPANVTEQVTAALENQVAEDMDWIDDDVPDPDMEDFLIAQTLPRNNSIFGRLSEYTLGRKSAAIPVVDKDVQQVDPDLNRKPSQMSFETDKDGHLQIPRPYLSADPTRSSSTKTVDSIKNENILNSATIKTIDRPFAENATIDRLSYVKTIDRPFMETYTLERADNPDALTRLGRFKTLPTNPHFRTPAFRSVPAWMPFRGIHMAWLVLITTSIVTIGNIIVNLIPQ